MNPSPAWSFQMVWSGSGCERHSLGEEESALFLQFLFWLVPWHVVQVQGAGWMLWARRRVNPSWPPDSFSHAFPIKITNTANRLEIQGTVTKDLYRRHRSMSRRGHHSLFTPERARVDYDLHLDSLLKSIRVMRTNLYLWVSAPLLSICEMEEASNCLIRIFEW